MSNFNNKINNSVADAVSKIMEAELSTKQKAIAKLAEPKHKIDGGDLAKLRAGHKPVKEEKEESCEDEAEEQVEKHEKKMHGKKGEVSKHEKEMHKEETEHLDELSLGTKIRAYAKRQNREFEGHEGGRSSEKTYASIVKKHGEKAGEHADDAAGVAIFGRRKNRMKEEYSFTSLIESYKKDGLKSIAKMKKMKEEVDSETYEKEMKDQKAKFDGKKKGGDVAKASVQAVQQEETHTEIQVIDMTDPDNIKKEIVNIEERTLTEPEAKKKEEIVKSMKKKLSGFKDRYGDRAKEVMYATATKQAMKESTESEHYKAGHEYAADHAQDSGFKVTARARKKEMLADNPHKKETPEHADWHRGALDGHQTALDNM